MSRKSKQTLWQERLAEISSCPTDIFDKIEPDEDTYAKIEKAEKNNVDAIRALVSELFDTYGNDEMLNSALHYYLGKGLLLNDKVCAGIMLECITRFNDCFSVLDTVIDTLGDDIGKDTENQIIDAKIKKVIDAFVIDADYAALANELSSIESERSLYARIFLEATRLEHTGVYEEGKIAELSLALGIPHVTTLPIFNGSTENAQVNAAEINKELTAVKYALRLIDMDQWRDFWIRTAYEYACTYLDGELNDLSEDIAYVIAKRCAYPNKMPHLLAVRKYLLDSAGSEEDEEYRAIEEKCRFEEHVFNLNDDSLRDELIREAVYTSGKAEREEKRIRSRFGTIVEHIKNRYSFSATMTGHVKRGCRHIWGITLSMENENDELPIFGTLKIDEQRHKVKRGGVTLEKEKKLSQVLCSGEITVAGKLCPIEIDLILDISYVSSTKCEKCNIKIKEHSRDGKYLVMKCALVIQ